jgi:small subunit ribosomal protein S20
MPNRPAALKTLHRDEKRTLRNSMVKSRLRTEQTKFARMIERGDAAAAEKQFNLLVKLLQRAADRKVIHPNRVARKQAQFQNALKALKAKAAPAA